MSGVLITWPCAICFLLFWQTSTLSLFYFNWKNESGNMYFCLNSSATTQIQFKWGLSLSWNLAWTWICCNSCCILCAINRGGAIMGWRSWSFPRGNPVILTFSDVHLQPLWHLQNALQLADSSNPQLQSLALDALDKSICAVLGSDQFQENTSSKLLDAPNNVRNFIFSPVFFFSTLVWFSMVVVNILCIL